MKRALFALLVFALLEACGRPVVWIGASAWSPVSGVVSSLAVPLDSRTVHIASSSAAAFNSSGLGGALIVVR